MIKALIDLHDAQAHSKRVSMGRYRAVEILRAALAELDRRTRIST